MSLPLAASRTFARGSCINASAHRPTRVRLDRGGGNALLINADASEPRTFVRGLTFLCGIPVF